LLNGGPAITSEVNGSVQAIDLGDAIDIFEVEDAYGAATVISNFEIEVDASSMTPELPGPGCVAFKGNDICITAKVNIRGYVRPFPICSSSSDVGMHVVYFTKWQITTGNGEDKVVLFTSKPPHQAPAQ
jgi:hypothetical protein